MSWSLSCICVCCVLYFFQVEFKGLVLYKMLIVILYSIAYFFFVKHRSRCLPEFSCCSFFMQWKHMVDRGCQAQKLMEKHTIIYISSLMICKNMPFKKTKEVWIGESANEIWLEELCTRTVVFGCIDKSGMTYLHAPYLKIHNCKLGNSLLFGYTFWMWPDL